MYSKLAQGILVLVEQVGLEFELGGRHSAARRLIPEPVFHAFPGKEAVAVGVGPVGILQTPPLLVDGRLREKQLFLVELGEFDLLRFVVLISLGPTGGFGRDLFE